MKLTTLECAGYERLVHAQEAESGLNAVICIHRLIEGQAAGGCRLWNYETDDVMIDNAKRLALTMTYKAVFSDVPLGGGKAVMRGNPTPEKRPAFHTGVQPEY